MKSICIVDDQQGDADHLKKYIERFCAEKNIEASIRIFKDGLDFLGCYKADADIVFLDVEMPVLSGIEVGRKIRETDPHVSIVFVTKMVKYALKGYEVSALDYIVKPISYYSVADCLRRAFLRKPVRELKKLRINVSASETVYVVASEIYYVKKNSNYLVYCTERGTFWARGSMKELEEELKGQWFSKSVNGCLVNLHYVEKTTQNSVYVNGEKLQLARPRRKEFMDDLMNYFGRGI